MTDGEDISYSTRIRKLQPSVISKLCSFIDQNDDWKRFAAHIPNTMGRPGLLYNSLQISQFESFGRQIGQSPTKEVLKDWGTRNINVGQLINVLKHDRVSLLNVVADLEDRIAHSSSRSADTHVLYEQTSQEHVRVPPSFDIRTESPSEMLIESADCEKSDEVHNYKYKELEDMTKKFSDERFIGHGGFSTVYLGYAGDKMLAVKRLKCTDNSQTRQFRTEIDVLKKFKHKNLLVIVGVSDDGDHFCIVYPYMVNGSLEDRLACKNNTAPLPSLVRVSIAKGTAEAINYLHTSQAKPMVHRDIKSANVLLDKDLVPKLGDFGLARQGPANKTALQTANVIGTAAYMAPEAIQGTITDKLDAFSFGVVLLELVTGLPSFDDTREEHTLTNLLDAHDYVTDELVDKTAGDWGRGVAQTLVDIAKRLTELKHRKRARVLEVVEDLRAI